MDSKRTPNNTKKRTLEDYYADRPRKIPCRDIKMEDDECGEKLFQFRVLLPNYRPREIPCRDIQMEDDACEEKLFQFRVLLPNSTTVELKMTELRNEIPVEELIDELREKYNILVKQRRSPEFRRRINWDYEDIHFTDAESRRIMSKVNLRNFKPNKWYFLWLHDGSPEPDVYQGMWDLTPDTDLLKELPDDYTFETALADLIDNSLQALWSNGKGERRLISIEFSPKKISIFDSGPGMDGSDGNLVKWGKMGASLHRSARGKAIGGEPPYLMPFFGMFGYGGPVATMCLGKHAVVSSKTKNCNKVFTLHLEREALVNASRSEHCWRTKGGTRDPTESEKDKAPHGSFTKVEIFEPKVKTLDIKSFRCKLKDIYFPYIQCDEVSGKTSTPVEFQVNGENLAEIEGGEVATTNLHSCNGPDFVVQLHFSISQSSSSMAGQNQRVFLEANARLKCVYFPITKGGESIQKILDSLTSDGFGTRENFESFSRVSVRRLGRLLPDTRWALLPFIEPKPIKGEKGHSLKRNCSRVKCFIDTDSGFNPTPHKTDLAQHHPYTKALKNFGNKAPENENEVEVEISRDGKKMSVTELEKQYTNWISEMHDCYDDEITGGDEPVIVLVSSMRKKLGITAEVVRVHKKIMRKGQCWTAGQKIKVLKGACPGCHNSNVYATPEYIILQGLPGDACGEARLICRPYDKPENKGCRLGNNNNTIDIRDSLVLPIRIIDSEKCIPVDEVEWGKKLEAHNQKSPSSIDLLSDIECQKLGIEGAFPTLVQAGDAPPMNIVAVIRPKSFRVENCSNRLDQKFICKDNLEIILEIKYRADEKRKGEFDHIYSARVSPSSHQGLHGIYLFPLRMKQPLLFKKAGFFTFSFFLVLRHSPSSNSREIRGTFSPQSSLKQVHIENAQEEEENHRSTRNHEDMMNVVISNHRPCESNEILRHSPSLKVPKETHGAFSPRSSQKLVNVENARKENFKSVRNDENMGNFLFSNHTSRENAQYLRHSPPLKVHTENGEENHRSTRNDEDMGNVFSDDRACGYDQFLPHTPSSRLTHETLSPPSSMKLIPYNCSSPVFMTPKMDLTDVQIENSATSIQDLGSFSQQELEDALVKSGIAVNEHDRELGRLRLYRRQIHRDITNFQASVDRDFVDISTTPTPTCDKELVLKQIESKKESAAFVMCKIPFESRPQDVLGVVALLGTVQSVELSRMLAEYLGEDQMLAIVCRNYTSAYHLKANNLGETISRGYHAVCLEDMRPRFVEPSSDPKQLLPLEAPILPNGNVPLGFLGYAVNMMDIEESHIQWRTESGYGLRETLFYRLFGELQVYKDAPGMFSAQSCIKEGALSLDGCIMRGNGLISLGHQEPPEILFPVNRPLSAWALRAVQSLAEKRLEMDVINKRIDEEESAYIRAKAELCMTREKFNSLSQNGSHCSW